MVSEERLIETVEKWRVNKGRGTIVWATRTGKNLLAIRIIERFLEKNPTQEVTIAVPTQALQYQWFNLLMDKGLYGQCKAFTYEYIIKNIKSSALLIIDEIHKSLTPTHFKLFSIKYKFILGLTTTFEREDERHLKLSKICPVIDTISKEEAIRNNWISNYKEYKVLIDAPDLEIYKEHDVKFQKYLNFFNQDLNLALSCVSSKSNREAITSYKHCKPQITDACTFGLNRELRSRIEFIQQHPKKLELVRLILEHRNTSKCVIFSPTIDISYKFEGFFYNSEMKIKEKLRELEGFKNCCSGVLSAVNGVSLGMELNNCDLVIMLSNNSSIALKEQKLDRMLLNTESGRLPEAFTFVLKHTVEDEWFKLSTKENDYITITEGMLRKLLNGEEILEERIEGPEMLNRY